MEEIMDYQPESNNNYQAKWDHYHFPEPQTIPSGWELSDIYEAQEESEQYQIKKPLKKEDPAP
jgi:hypothetical protein